MSFNPENGIISKLSKVSVEQATQTLQEMLRARGVTLFALVDHSGEAAKVGLQMRPTKLLIFGNPQAGTPLMIASPAIAIDLPLKILIWEDGTGKTWLSYVSPSHLQARYKIPAELVPNIAVVETLVSKLAE